MEYDYKFKDVSKKDYILLLNIQRASASLSLSGSLYIIYQIVWNDPSKEKLSNTYQRIMLTLSICDIFSSMAQFVGNWAIPSDTIYESIVNNYGNQTTCNIQGFSFVLGLIGVMFCNAALSVYFLMCIKYNWTNEALRRKVERPLYAALATIGFLLCILPLCLEMYNPMMSACYVEPYPLWCEEKSNNVECIRGSIRTAVIFRYFYFIPLFFSFCVILFSMTQLFRTVRRQTIQASRFASDNTLKRLSEHSRKVYWRAYWYVLSFTVVWLPALILNNCPYSFILQIIVRALMPLQGKACFV